MASDVGELGSQLGYPSVLVLWIAVLLRWPSVVRSPQQRGVWLAVATAAAAMTLNLPAVTSLAGQITGPTQYLGLARNVLGVLSAGAVLYFVVASTTGGRLLRTGLCIATAAVLAALLLLDLTGPRTQTGIPDIGKPVPCLLFWLIVIGTQLVANTLCVVMCWRYGGRSGSRSLSLSLRLFGLGTAFAGVYWLGYLIRLCTGSRWPLPYLLLFMDVHGLLRAAAILVPTFFAVRRTASDIATTWRLWPLWHDLVAAVPHVALTKPRARLLDVVWPQVPHRVLAYRKVIETSDAILALNDYIRPSAPSLARRYVTDAAVPASCLDATVLACVIKDARQAKLAGLPPGRLRLTVWAAGRGDLASEQAFLLQMARAYRSVPVHAFEQEPDRPAPCAG